jgi:hypothetical protein
VRLEEKERKEKEKEKERGDDQVPFMVPHCRQDYLAQLHDYVW